MNQPTPNGDTMTYQQERELLSAALDSFPTTFKIISPATGHDLFRIDRIKSYVNGAGSVQLVIQTYIGVCGADGWTDYCRTTPSQLRAQILRPIHS